MNQQNTAVNRAVRERGDMVVNEVLRVFASGDHLCSAANVCLGITTMNVATEIRDTINPASAY